MTDISKIINVSNQFIGRLIKKMNIPIHQYGSAKLIKIDDFISLYPILKEATENYIRTKNIQSLTADEIAEIMDLTSRTVVKKMERGEINYYCANIENGTMYRVLKSEFVKQYPEYESIVYRVIAHSGIMPPLVKQEDIDVESVEVYKTPNADIETYDSDDFDKISNTSSVILTDLTDDEKELEEEEQESVEETENELQAIVNAVNGYSTAPVQDALILAGQFDNECEEEPVEIVQDDTILVQLHDMTDEFEKHSIPFKRYCELTYIDTIIGSCTKGSNINKFSIRKKDAISGMEYEIVEYIDSLKHKVTCTRYYVIGVDDEEESRMLVCSITYDSKHRISSKAEFVPSPYMNYPALQYSDFYTYHDNDVVSKRVRLCGEAITTQTFDRDGNLKDIQSELFVNDMTNTVNHGYDRVKLTNR